MQWCRALAFAAVLFTAAVLADAGDAVVRQPRPFGYTVGDIAVQQVLLAREGRAFTPATLPGPARVSAWLERRTARVEAAPDGARWLVVEYQVVNAPRSLATVAVPRWELAGAAGAAPLRIAPAALSIGPLTAPVAPTESLPLRPDRPAPVIDTAAMQRTLSLWLAALATCLAGWLAYAGWSAWRARTALPFTRALRTLRGQQAGAPAAFQALHQAFDRTAGRVVHAGTLDALFQRAPHLQPLRPQIEAFYAQSAQLFFGPGLPADAVSPQALCTGLSRLERRHAP
ncbi:calcium incorporation protein MxaA [Ramlibacter alkalitolerans]|uniref:Calcium incorporation protein MxaA n=1 Tax=Ramlibacter alkalitolerans TaxID=2039631 RepID=A0ABS1JKD2_9BURK|nr:calcium incorporation protein MxaA [Ramlibacter alkalitolerans]MBL0424683.1 calcium incorporation protein MxaA [Ramlibacter alkalitolerans]